jgi:hypothetical protein
MCTCVRDFSSGSLSIQGLKEGSRPISVLFITVNPLQLNLRWHVTNQFLVRCNESECKQKIQNNSYFANVTDCTVHHERFVTSSLR